MNTTSKKPRRDKNESVLRKLPPEQRAMVDRWLFKEQKTCREVKELCLKEFKAGLSESAVLRYYHSENRRRKTAELAQGVNAGSDEPLSEPKTPRERYEAVLAGVEKMALGMSRHRPEDVKARDVADIVHLLIAARREANEASRVALAREKLEYDVATACLIHKIEMEQICDDRTLDDGQRIRAIREELFGPNLPE